MGREPSFFHQANAECETGLGSECHSNFHQSKFSNGPLPPMNLKHRSWTPFAPLTEHDCVPRLSKAAVILILRVPINQRDTGCDMLIVTGGCSIERTGPPAPMPSAAQLLKLKACIDEERRPGAGWQFEFRLVVLIGEMLFSLRLPGGSGLNLRSGKRHLRCGGQSGSLQPPQHGQKTSVKANAVAV